MCKVRSKKENQRAASTGKSVVEEWPSSEPATWRRFLAFWCCQCWLMVLVTLTSQARSLASSSTSSVAKNLMLFCEGLPSGLSNRAFMSAGISCGWQFSTQPACSAVRRAGSWFRRTGNAVDCLSYKTNRSPPPIPNRQKLVLSFFETLASFTGSC